jgi:thioredoxin-related protein
MHSVVSFFSLVTLVILSSLGSAAQTTAKKKAKKTKSTKSVKATVNKPSAITVKESQEIHWLTWAQATEKMAVEPRKVYVDVYTDWCGWCKVMDKKTFSDARVAKFMNDNFYCIKFNAEKDDNIAFQSKVYSIENGVNTLASKLMNGKLSYPTSIVMMENFLSPSPIPGYLDLENFDVIMHYIQSNSNTKMPFEQYKAEYQYVWK